MLDNAGQCSMAIPQYSRDFAAFTSLSRTCSLHPAGAPTLHDRHQVSSGIARGWPVREGPLLAKARSEAALARRRADDAWMRGCVDDGHPNRPRVLQVRIHPLPALCILLVHRASCIVQTRYGLRPGAADGPGLPSTSSPPCSALKQKKLHDHVPGGASMLAAGMLLQYLLGTARLTACGVAIPASCPLCRSTDSRLCSVITELTYPVLSFFNCITPRSTRCVPQLLSDPSIVCAAQSLSVSPSPPPTTHHPLHSWSPDLSLHLHALVLRLSSSSSRRCGQPSDVSPARTVSSVGTSSGPCRTARPHSGYSFTIQTHAIVLLQSTGHLSDLSTPSPCAR